MLAGWVAGAVVMVAGYFFVTCFLYGPGPAIGEATTINLPHAAYESGPGRACATPWISCGRRR